MAPPTASLSSVIGQMGRPSMYTYTSSFFTIKFFDLSFDTGELQSVIVVTKKSMNPLKSAYAEKIKPLHCALKEIKQLLLNSRIPHLFCE